MATQLLNAEAEVATSQDLLGHSCVSATERYCTVSNIKVMRDYLKAMEMIMQKTSREQPKKERWILTRTKN
ncbi:MAG: hypothetical protein ABII06_09920 [Pseudomonadota bacterium]